MLNRQQLKKYRELRGLSTRQVAEYCDISQPMIVNIETGARHMTQYCHDEIVRGINEATNALRRREAEKEDAAAQENTGTEGEDAPISQEPTRADISSDEDKKETCKKRPAKRKKIPKQADDAG